MMWENGQETSVMFVLSLSGPVASSGDSSLSAFKCIQIPSLSPKKNTQKNHLPVNSGILGEAFVEWLPWFSPVQKS